MVTKGDLGVGYLAGIGLAIIGLLVWRLGSFGQPAYLALIGTTTGVMLAGAMVYLAYWLTQSDLQADHVWAVSRWGAVGLTLPTVATLGLGVLQAESVVLVEPSVLVNNAAAGAVIGALFGAITELETEHGRAAELNRRNVVLNRVLRHDIRNDVSLLLAYGDRYRADLNSAGKRFLNAVEDKVDEIIALTEAAKWVDDLESGSTGEPIEAVEIIKERCQVLEGTHPEATIQVDLPDELWVNADELLRTVVDNLLENAIEHHDAVPNIKVSGRNLPSEEAVTISIMDDGPGLPDQHRSQLDDWGSFDARQGPPGEGLGLWLVRWFVDSYDGTIDVSHREPRGTTITLRLRNASPPKVRSQKEILAA